MADTKEKLIEIIGKYYEPSSVPTFSLFADYLIANGVTVQKWIPVTERLPDIELVDAKTEELDLFACLVNKIAFHGTRKSYITKAWYDGKGFIDIDCIDITNEITHWMPLQEPPKGE